MLRRRLYGLLLLVVGCSSGSVTHSLFVSELIRGQTWLAGHPHQWPMCLPHSDNNCRREGVSDVDRDGYADCWRVEDHQWSVWKGCIGEPLELDDNWAERVAVIPSPYASPVWLMWLSRALREQISCADFAAADCGPITPRWRWILAATHTEYRDGIALHGTVDAPWQSGLEPETASGALIVADAPNGWLLRQRLPEFGAPPPAPRGARIVTTVGGATGPRVDCAGLQIALVGGGLVAIDKASARWRWLFAPLPQYNGRMETLICRRNLAIATNQSAKLFVAPGSGDWLFEPGTDVVGAELFEVDDDDALWPSDQGDLVRLSLLGPWLALPPERRPPLRTTMLPEFRGLEITNDDDMFYHGDSINRIDAEPGRRRRDFESVPREELIPVINSANLTDRGKCGRYTVFASKLAVIALRNNVGYWLQLQVPSTPTRIRSVTCDHKRIVIERMLGRNLLATEEDSADIIRVTFDIDHGWLEIARPSR